MSLKAQVSFKQANTAIAIYQLIKLFLEAAEYDTLGQLESCSCNTGVRKRDRTCTNPTLSLYGHYCIGDPVEYDICSWNRSSNMTSKGDIITIS